MSMISKKSISILFLILIVLCSSCGGSAKAESTEATTETTEETTVAETVAETLPRIDLSDVEDESIRDRLVRIDEINQKIGKEVYVSKEDFLKYRNTSISIIGDSISDLSRGVLVRYFTNMFQDSVSGRELAKGIECYDNMVARGKLGDIMVFSLGTNAKEGMQMNVFEYIHKKLEGKPMITFTTYFPYKGQRRTRNREIRKFVETHDNVWLADWCGLMEKHHNDYIVQDGTHPNYSGSEVYTQLLFKTVVDVMKSQGK